MMMIPSDDPTWYPDYTSGTIVTYSGKRVAPLDFKPSDFDIEDVSRALGNISRYGGHCPFYSVAEHCLYVENVVRRWGGDIDDRLTALLHDSSEAYLGDIVRPLKKTDAYAAYRAAEEQMERAIMERHDLAYPFPLIVRDADLAMCPAIEAAVIRDFGGRWGPVEAATRYRQKYNELVWEKYNGPAPLLFQAMAP